MKIREKCAEKKLLKVYFQWNCSAWCCNTIISASSCSWTWPQEADLGWSLHFTLHRSHLLLAITINDRQLKRKHPCQHQLSVQILQNWGKSREISFLYNPISFRYWRGWYNTLLPGRGMWGVRASFVSKYANGWSLTPSLWCPPALLTWPLSPALTNIMQIVYGSNPLLSLLEMSWCNTYNL